MIRINLLPYDLRPIKRTPIPYIIAIGILVGAVIYGILIFSSKFAELKNKDSLIQAGMSELERMGETVAEFEKLTQQKESLGVKIEAIDGIIADRVIWSKQLEQLAKLTPTNIWYDEIKLMWKTAQVWVVKLDRKGEVVIDKKTGQPEQVRENQKKAFLQISGYVASDPETGERDINPLTQALQGDPEFASRYDLRDTLLEDVELPEYGKVRKFTLEYEILSQQGTAG